MSFSCRVCSVCFAFDSKFLIIMLVAKSSRGSRPAYSRKAAGNGWCFVMLCYDLLNEYSVVCLISVLMLSAGYQLIFVWRKDGSNSVYSQSVPAWNLHGLFVCIHIVIHGGMASVNQTWPHCVNQMGKTHSKPLAAYHGRGTTWVRHGHSMLCVNRP